MLLLLGMQGKKERPTIRGEDARRRRQGRVNGPATMTVSALSLRCLVNGRARQQRCKNHGETLGANCGEHSVVMASTEAGGR